MRAFGRSREACDSCALFDIELGRILLCKEGYQGTAEEVAATAVCFDAKVRDVLPVALAAKLCEALPVAAVRLASKMRKQ